MTRPLIRPSGTFSPRGGEKDLESPRPAQRGEGGAKRRVRGRVITSSSAHRAVPRLRMTIVVVLALAACRTARPPYAEPIAPLTASTPDAAARQLAERRSDFRGERSLVRLRLPDRSARGQLQVDREGRMLLTIYTPLGTIAARLYVEGDEVIFLNTLQSTAWRGKANEFAGSLGLFGSALAPSSLALLLVGLPPAVLDSISYASSGMESVRLPDLLITYDPPAYPPKRVMIDRGARHVEIEHLESYADPEVLKAPSIPDDYRCCVLPQL